METFSKLSCLIFKCRSLSECMDIMSNFLNFAGYLLPEVFSFTRHDGQHDLVHAHLENVFNFTENLTALPG